MSSFVFFSILRNLFYLIHIWALHVYFDMGQKMCYNATACSEGKSFVRNDGPDKARTEMSVLIRLFFCLKGGCINEWIS